MNRDLTEGSIRTLIWKFTLPLLGSMLFQQLYNIADSLVAGKFIGPDALAAVGNSYEITLIFIAFLYQKEWLKIGVGDIVLLTGYFSSITTMVMQAMNCIPAITKGLESVRSVGEVLECPDIELNENKPQVTEVKGDFVFVKLVSYHLKICSGFF